MIDLVFNSKYRMIVEIKPIRYKGKDVVEVSTSNVTGVKVTGTWGYMLDTVEDVLFHKGYSRAGHRDVIIKVEGVLVTKDHPLCKKLANTFGDKWWIKGVK